MNFYQIFYYQNRLLLLKETYEPPKTQRFLMHNMKKKQFVCTSF